jgi:hypothetical protein
LILSYGAIPSNDIFGLYFTSPSLLNKAKLNLAIWPESIGFKRFLFNSISGVAAADRTMLEKGPTGENLTARVPELETMVGVPDVETYLDDL